MTIVQNSSLTDIQIKFLQSLGDLIEEMNSKNTDETSKSEVFKESISKIDKTNELLDKIAQSDNPENDNDVELHDDNPSIIDFEVTKEVLIVGKNGRSYIYDDDKLHRLMENGWSKMKIANEIGVSPISFNKYINGNNYFNDVNTRRTKSNDTIVTSDESSSSIQDEDPL